ncbi:MAG TPA: DinB family protein [Thermoanaerobaculia bacterium]|nr:DinB family protein [Thermoanaerobaculia bacterium]
MNNDKSLRDHLLELLESNQAHISFADAVKDFPRELRGKRPDGSPHTAWQLLEHLRLAQWDILEFTRDPKHVSPDFPQGYWPSSEAPPDDEAWNESVEGFRRDLKGLADLARDESLDLHAPIAHGTGQTVLRELLLAADHNAYHLGQLMIVRKMLDA